MDEIINSQHSNFNELIFLNTSSIFSISSHKQKCISLNKDISINKKYLASYDINMRNPFIHRRSRCENKDRSWSDISRINLTFFQMVI